MTPVQQHRSPGSLRPARSRPVRRIRGYSMVELMIAMLMGTILTAIAIPQVKSQVYSYRLSSAVAMAKWAIQSTRFQALMKGYPYQVAFTASTQSYQIQNLPSGTTYANVGGSVPLAVSIIDHAKSTLDTSAASRLFIS